MDPKGYAFGGVEGQSSSPCFLHPFAQSDRDTQSPHPWHKVRMMNVFIRKAVLADIPDLMTLRASVRENRPALVNAVTVDDVADFMRHSPIWVWQENQRILGFSAGDTQLGWIWALFVDPGHEGRGIGTALLGYACRSVAHAGFYRATLTTDPGTRAAAFYRRAGWIAAGETEEGEIIFERRLPARSRHG
jgi:ribosomal protein S18 acetylase RimI-like enzyme